MIAPRTKHTWQRDRAKRMRCTFTNGGQVGLDLKQHAAAFSLHWIDIGRGEWGNEKPLQGGQIVPYRSTQRRPLGRRDRAKKRLNGTVENKNEGQKMESDVGM